MTARPVALSGTGEPSTISGSPRPLPAWPLEALLWGFPVWWLLGLAPFIVVMAAAVMGCLLLARGRLRLLAGTTPWIAYVLWTLPCALALDSGLRLIGYGQRVANLAATAVIVLYVANAPERLPRARITASLAALWVMVVVGGYLGTLWPDVRLTTPTGLVLPGALTSNSYVKDLVFPPFAEVQQPWGAPEPYNRPSAPFPYANGWGSAMALLTPVAVAQLLITRSTRARAFLGVTLALASVPALASLNRGMFLALTLAVLYVAVRLVLRGKVLPMIAVAAGAALAAVGFTAAGLLDGITSRTQYSDTNQGRAAIYEETFTRTLHSPFVGYGAPRPSEVLDVSAGTQGHLWQVMFSYGFVGLALFLWFLWGATWRTRSPAGTPGLWLHACLVVACMSIFYYGLDTMQMLAITLVAVVLLREAATPSPAHRHPVPVRRATA